ncbi:phosphatidylinositol phosphatase PTPRQ-like [Homarus americanus]|uniref:phosphatidylinositol phosphatase PTPRQ-like n=1 Tax=Homarus americanus TaxID=6706 RepID=UPI001C47481A|nr:phosphatidylinositol phosphatase PTPRQ-like [Homarus americanus]
MVVVQIHHLAEHTITQLRPGPPTTCVWPPTKTEYNNDKCTNTTTDEDKPGPPVIMSVEPAPSSSLRVSWSTPEKPNGVITNYTITWTWEGHMDHTITPDNTYTTTDLLPCTTYSVTVRAATSKGYGPESDPLTGTTYRVDPDPYLQDVMAAKVMDQSSQLFVNWTAVQGVGNCVVTYRITWRPVSESDGGGTSYTTSLSYTITQLEAWTTYQVCVAATTKTKYNNDKCTNTTTDEDSE